MPLIPDTLTDPKVRAYLYRVLTACAPLLVVYGVANDADIALWIALAGTILGNGVAAYNTPRPGAEG